MSGARRIAALSTEAVETLYLIGAQDRLVGISGFTVHPPEARREKPKVSGYSSAQTERILAVEPDLVIAFSDMQAELCGGNGLSGGRRSKGQCAEGKPGAGDEGNGASHVEPS